MGNKKIIVFKLDNNEYAVETLSVERIIGFEIPTKIPETSPHIEGVIQFQDKVIPVVNTKKRLGILNSQISKESKIIVLKNKKGKVGIIVDSVVEILDIDENSMERVTKPLGAIYRKSKEFSGVAILEDGRLALVIDAAKNATMEELSS